MNVVAEMLLADPAPLAIWGALILLTFPAMLMLSSPAGLRHPRRAAAEMVAVLRERGERRRRQVAEAGRAVRYAEEVRTAADRAEVSAQRWQELGEQAERDRDAAWQAWLDADARLRGQLAAAAWGIPWSVRTCEEYAVRERHLHRCVAAAAGRGELPAAAVADALAGRNGWDARLHPLEQDLVIARASVAWLRRRYDRAVAAEQSARHDAELARTAALSLRHEAQTATAVAGELSRRPTGANAPIRVLPAIRLGRPTPVNA